MANREKTQPSGRPRTAYWAKSRITGTLLGPGQAGRSRAVARDDGADERLAGRVDDRHELPVLDAGEEAAGPRHLVCSGPVDAGEQAVGRVVGHGVDGV